MKPSSMLKASTRLESGESYPELDNDRRLIGSRVSLLSPLFGKFKVEWMSELFVCGFGSPQITENPPAISQIGI